MGAKKKQTIQETGRWLRVGTLMLTTLGPVINLLTERLRAQKKASGKENTRESTKNNPIYANSFDAPEKMQAIGAALTDVLVQLREHPYSQELLQRGGHLTDDLQERWSRLPHDAARYSAHLEHKARKNVQIQQQKQAEQDRHLWVFLGFGVGISIATISTVLFLRRRQKQPNDMTPIQLYNGAVDHAYNGYKKERKQTDKIDATSKIKTNSQQGKQVATEHGVALADTQTEKSKPVIPANAVLVGVVSTMRYYPLETPSDQLPTVHSQALELIYFVSETEAKAHGFTAAE